MIINQFTCTQIGDALIIQTVPMLGITALNTYSDSTTGETSNAYFTRQFKYSLDGGVTFTALMQLNNTNLQSINSVVNGNFNEVVLEFFYQRAGTDNTGDVTLNNITINGGYIEIATNFNVTNQTFLKGVSYNNIDVLLLMVNLAQKLYAEGIVPNYLIRGTNTDTNLLQDADYIDFWQTVAYFYSMITIDSFKYENIYWNRPLLCQYLQQKNIFICDCSDIIELQLIAQYFYDEIRKRGTLEIFNPKGYQYPAGYRYAYAMPTNYVIAPSTGVLLDGIIYPEVGTLPFGWTINTGNLIAPERNYHYMRFYNSGTGNYDLAPNGYVTLLPTNNSGILKLYNGEFLRLICFNNQCDEFLYNNAPKIYTGWCLGKSSPLYRGLRPQRTQSIIKGYEDSFSVQDLSVYPIFTNGGGTALIGLTTDYTGADTSVLYLNNDGQPCLLNVLPQLTNVITHLTLNFNYIAGTNINGVVNLTNTTTHETFQIPVSLNATIGGIVTTTIDTDLVPALYQIEFSFSFTGKMTGSLVIGGLEFDFNSTTGNVDQIYALTNVPEPTMIGTLNFSL